MSQATLATLDGRLEEAMNAGPRLIARADELGSPVFGRQFAGMVTTLPGIYLGRSEEVQAGWRDVDQMAGAEVESWVRNATRALLLAHVGRMGEAQALLDRYLNEYGVADEEHESGVRVLCSLQEASVLLEDRQAASDLSRRLASLASTGPVAAPALR